jgi:ATP-binding cassette, subfamily B, bacterial
MRLVSFVSEKASTSGPSGLSGSTDIPEPPRSAGPRGLRARKARIQVTLRGVIAGVPRVLALSWAAGRALTFWLGCASVLAGLVPVATAYLARLLINTVATAVRLHAEHRTPRLTLDVPLPGGTLHTSALTVTTAIVALVVAQFALLITSSLVNAVSQICTDLLQDKVALDVQLRIMDHASRLDLAFFEDSRSYDLLSQASNEATVRPVTMISGLFGMIQTVITFTSMIGLLATLSPLLALLAVTAPVPAFLADLRYGVRGFRLRMWTSPARRRMDYLSQLVTHDTYAKEVQVFGLASYLVTRFRLLGRAYYRSQRRLLSTRRLAAPAWGTISVLTGSAIYAYVAFSAVSGSLTLGDLALYTVAATAVQASVQNLFQGISALYESNLYIDLLYRLLATEPNVRSPDRPEPLPAPVRGHVLFEQVSFSYPGARAPALQDVSFEILPGQTLAVVGPNGAGKSTLLKLLCRLYDPGSGRILLDGVDIAALDLQDLRGQIGALFQDHISYHATVAENIGLGDVDRVEDRHGVRLAAQQAGAAQLIDDLPSGYDTPLGKWFDQGVNLSGGEWQKVALSRAFMRAVPLLVLDEPSSALDARAEHELFTRLADLAVGRTTVYISHRFSTVRRADRILVLDGGHIVESGTHDQLVDAAGVYAELFKLQAQAYVGEPPG